MPHKVKNHSDIVRDELSNGIINTDSDALRLYKLNRDEKRKLSQLISGYENLKNDVTEIKSLLLKLLEKNN